jgi:hypothetical protein
MKKISAILALLCMAASAHAIQNLELKEYPALKPLNSCKHSDGVTRYQIEPCGPDTTVDTRVFVEAKQDSLQKFGEPGLFTPPQMPVSKNEPTVDTQGGLSNSWKSLGKWLGFALIVGLLAKMIFKGSFLFWFFLGGILRMILVSLNVIAY